MQARMMIAEQEVAFAQQEALSSKQEAATAQQAALELSAQLAAYKARFGSFDL
jgi:hypothetical protein